MVETYENGILKECLRCKKQIVDPEDDDIYCTQCGSILLNRCTNHPDFYGDMNTPPCGAKMKPDAAYCSKCSEITTFNSHQLIDVKYAKTEIEPKHQLIINTNDDDLPF